MSRTMQLLLLALAATLVAVDAGWAGAGGFVLDLPAYGVLALLALAITAGGIFYDRVRIDPHLCAMLLGTAYLIVISASLSALNYLLLGVAGHRIDAALAGIDRGLGIDWPAMMALASRHPMVNALLQIAYNSVLPQIALLVVVAGLRGSHEEIPRLCLAITIGAGLWIAVWTIAPSFGAVSIYALPANVTAHLSLALDAHYARQLEALLAHGPGLISPRDAKGLIGFPSYHAVLVLLVIWYARRWKGLFWIAAAFGAAALIATPIQGGHHVIDVIAGGAVAMVAIISADRLAQRIGRPAATPAGELAPAGDARAEAR